MDKSILKLLLLIIVIIYISTYLIASSGYYEYTMQQRTVLTKEKIKEFENDIKEQKDIDLKEYYVKEEMDYSNKFTTLVYNISDSSNEITKKIIKKIFKKIGSMVED